MKVHQSGRDGAPACTLIGGTKGTTRCPGEQLRTTGSQNSDGAIGQPGTGGCPACTIIGRAKDSTIGSGKDIGADGCKRANIPVG
jgi:hypothetical protein